MTVTVTAKDSGGAGIPGATVWLPFVTDAQGQVPFSYHTPTRPPTNLRDDSLIAADKATNGCLFSSHYRFLPPSGTRTDRIAGLDPYNTAADITGTYEAPGATDSVFIATGLNFPDALAGAAVAGALHAPVELVTLNAIPGLTLASLTNVVKPHSMVVLGGIGVVSDLVMSQLAALP